jgi:hypothetical protein
MASSTTGSWSRVPENLGEMPDFDLVEGLWSPVAEPSKARGQNVRINRDPETGLSFCNVAINICYQLSD